MSYTLFALNKINSYMKIATREAFGEALAELGKTHKDIVVLDADLSGSTKTNLFAKAFPDRFFNMGIAEQDMIGTAAGLAVAGKNVFAASFAVFIVGRAYDQIRNTVAYSHLNVKIVGSHAGILTGEDGATHQMLEDLSLMRGLPDMLVLCPSDSIETKQIVEFLADYEGPAYLRLGRAGVHVLHNDSYHFQLGKGDILREGKNICIIATGTCVSHSLMAAEKLESEKISAQVINIASIKPFDNKMIEKLGQEFSHIFTIEDHSIYGGLGSATAEVLAETGSKSKLHRIGMTTFGESGTPDDLYEKYGLDSDGIFNKILQIIR